MSAEASLLDLVDDVLQVGVSVDGELVLGLAGVDLVYLRLALLLAGADRCLPPQAPRRRARRRVRDR